MFFCERLKAKIHFVFKTLQASVVWQTKKMYSDHGKKENNAKIVAMSLRTWQKYNFFTSLPEKTLSWKGESAQVKLKSGLLSKSGGYPGSFDICDRHIMNFLAMGRISYSSHVTMFMPSL